MAILPGLTVKAIINRFNGCRFEGVELTPAILEYAEQNRDHFNFIYTGDMIEGPSDGDRIENSPAKGADEVSVGAAFSKDQLIKLNKAHLLELAESMKLTIEGDATKDAIADLIVAEQNKGG